MESRNKKKLIVNISADPDSMIDYFKKIWDYKNLIWVFAKRDLKVKYSQTFIGISWSVIQPLTALLIFSFFFGYILKWKTNDLPYPIYVLSGLLGWGFFSYIVQSGASSIQESATIIKKIYFPKSILPLSKVIVASVELSLNLVLLIILILFFKITISWRIVFFPFVLFFNALCGLAIVFWIGSFAYRRRDLLHIIPFIVNFGIWFTPVFFSPDFLPEKYKPLMELNPIANTIDLWRWMLFATIPFNTNWIISFFIVLILVLTGMFYYNSKESKFSDYV
jgi:lipopolysaccharide transport system permease protein